MKNLFDKSHSPISKEIIEIIANTNNCRIERIVSLGQTSPADFWYDQNETEWVCLLEGSAKIQFLNREIELKKGEHLFIKAHEKHRVSFTSLDCIWLAIFMQD